MKTTRELGRFLADNRLTMRVHLTKEGFTVELSAGGPASVFGDGITFPDAIDRAIHAFAKARTQVLLS